MSINCDYCGSSIDTTKHNACPFCGASYNNNQEYQENLKLDKELKELKLKELKERQEFNRQQNELELEKEKIELEIKKKKKNLDKSDFSTVKPKKKKSRLGQGCLVFLIIIAVIIVCFFLFCAYCVKVAMDETRENPELLQTETVALEPEIVEIPVSGGFNETLSTSAYSVTITELKPAATKFGFKPKEGNMHIAINFVVENISDKEIDSYQKVTCMADGFLADYYVYSDDTFLPSTQIPAGTKITGYHCFEVPADAKEFTIKYGDYMTFTIENTIEQ